MHVSVYLSVCIYTNMSVGTTEARGAGSPEASIPGGCESAGVGAGVLTLILWKNSVCS